MPITRVSWGCIALVSGLTACSLVEPPNYDRTYPQAFDVERVSLEAASLTVEAPDTVNVVVYVVDINICPPELRCIMPDGILIAEGLNPERPAETLHLSAAEPRQFRKQSRYTMSVAVSDRHIEGMNENAVWLLGYSHE